MPFHDSSPTITNVLALHVGLFLIYAAISGTLIQWVPMTIVTCGGLYAQSTVYDPGTSIFPQKTFEFGVVVQLISLCFEILFATNTVATFVSSLLILYCFLELSAAQWNPSVFNRGKLAATTGDFNFQNVQCPSSQLLEDCTVCLEPFNDGHTLVKATNCRHLFHKACLITWSRQKPMLPTCPLCRADLRTTPIMLADAAINDGPSANPTKGLMVAMIILTFSVVSLSRDYLHDTAALDAWLRGAHHVPCNTTTYDGYDVYGRGAAAPPLFFLQDCDTDAVEISDPWCQEKTLLVKQRTAICRRKRNTGLEGPGHASLWGWVDVGSVEYLPPGTSFHCSLNASLSLTYLQDVRWNTVHHVSQMACTPMYSEVKRLESVCFSPESVSVLGTVTKSDGGVLYERPTFDVATLGLVPFLRTGNVQLSEIVSDVLWKRFKNSFSTRFRCLVCFAIFVLGLHFATFPNLTVLSYGAHTCIVVAPFVYLASYNVTNDARATTGFMIAFVFASLTAAAVYILLGVSANRFIYRFDWSTHRSNTNVDPLN